MKEHIHAAYNGEIYGVAFFSYFADNYADRSHFKLWKALIDVEKLTAKCLEPYLESHSIEYDRNDQCMQLKGKEDAAIWINLAWPELVKTLLNWVEPYEIKYREWAEQASTDNQEFQLIAAHETAIYECWKSEMSGQDGLPILLKFLNDYSKP